ncbi:ribosome maturation factor RimM [Massilia sp. NEAU-DD11]|uniref:Ribosome maturation factor RimM n=1 Tax=Massilia cellulosiltytica TaxID=2683234 RepID=A0A7X3G579_9BURK|nr:ribosome maturation factor RimM [Telluria cellulosilytica]MVW63864.1 ribosome maturation factor RimM [Telluria cellulosilytica]
MTDSAAHSTSASAQAVPDDLIQVGHITGAYGLRGGVRVTPYSMDADALLSVKTWWIDKPSLRAVQMRNAKYHSGDVTATLVDVNDREAAEALKGATVQVSRSDFPELPEDEYYWTDLIGLDTVNLQGEALGKVSDMMHNGAQSILRITPVPDPNAAPDAKAPERLVPFVDQYVKTVDLQAKVITLDWGLDY